MMGELVFRISPTTAALGSFAVSFTYVGSLYLWRLAGFPETNRDAKGTVQRRFISAMVSTACSGVLVHALSQPAGAAAPGGVPGRGFTLCELLGVQLRGVVVACASSLGLTTVLFVGPLAQHWASVALGYDRPLSLPGGLWVSLRNYVMAPLTEEFVFRACLVRLWVGASISQRTVIFLSPLCFAMAHTHHFIEHVRRLHNKQQALLQVAFQVFYTSLFGMYSNFLLLRIGSTMAVILTHSFCNHQGFPDVSFVMAGHRLYPHRYKLGAAYLVGILAFGWLMMPMTQGFDSSFNSASRAD